MLVDYFVNTISRDLYSLVVGERIGSGLGREVYEYRPDPSLVIKFETGNHSFQNVKEWENWKEWQYAPNIMRWLAPCISISACGTILLQRRTTTIIKLPDKLPEFLTDRKPENYGMFKGKLVCHDYASLIVAANDRLTKVKIS